MAPTESPGKSEPPHRSENRINRTTAVISLIAALIGLVGGLVGGLAADEWLGGLFRSKASVTLHNPKAGLIEYPVDVLGEVEGLPPGEDVWLVIWAGDEGARFYPQDKPCLSAPDGTLKCAPVYVGTKTSHGKRYEIFAVQATASVARQFIEYNINVAQTGKHPGLVSLPEDPPVLARVAVTRK